MYIVFEWEPDTAIGLSTQSVLVAVPAERTSAGIRSSVMQPAGSQWWPLALLGLQVCRTDG